MEKKKFSLYTPSEKFLMVLSTAIFFMMSYFYIKDISLRRLILGNFFSDSDRLKHVGSVSKVEGELNRQTAEDFEFKEIKNGSVLFANDTIFTQENSSAKITLDNGQEFDIPASTLIKLDFSNNLSVGGVVQIQVIKSATLAITEPVKKVKKYVKPVEVIARATPIPTPTPKPIIPLVVQKTSLTNGSTFTFTKEEFLSKKKRIPVEIELNHAPEEVTRISLTHLDSQREIASTSPQFADKKAGLAFIVSMPGSYEWNLFDSRGQVLTKNTFKVEPKIQIIETAPPATHNNRLKGYTTKKDFEGFALEWKPVPNSGTEDYVVRIFDASGKMLLTKTLKANRLVLNKNNLILGNLYYIVEKKLPKGFLALSPRTKFSFNFLPPELAEPAEAKTFDRLSLKKNNNLVFFTWSKTNYTDQYLFEISNSRSFESVLFNRSVSENYLSIPIPQNGTHYWRVRSISGKNTSDSSVIRSFAVLK